MYLCPSQLHQYSTPLIILFAGNLCLFIFYSSLLVKFTYGL